VTFPHLATERLNGQNGFIRNALFPIASDYTTLANVR